MNYDFDNAMGLDRDECMWLTAFCRRHGIQTVLEFGPGNSTQAMLDGGVGRIDSFEDDAQFAELMRSRFDGRVRVHPYVGTEFPIGGQLLGVDRFHLAFIDGPKGSIISPARLNAALFCFRKAERLIFHDSNRDGKTLEIMEQIGCVAEECHHSKRGLKVLRTPRV